MEIESKWLLMVLAVLVLPPASAFAGMATNTMALLTTIAASIPTAVEAESKVLAPEDRVSQCLRLLYDTFGENESIYNTVADILLNGKEKDRSNFLSICSAFHDRPGVMTKHVKEIVKCKQTRSTWGKPLHNGTVYTSLPISMTWSFNFGGNVLLQTIGHFQDVDNDGLLDYIVSFSTNSGLGCPTGSTAHFDYQATFINQGTGWTMNDCRNNIPANVLSMNCFPFLLPCE